MDLSINQLVSETKKALCGKGYDFGTALDIAKAVELLALYQFDISPSVTDMLTQDESRHDRLSETDNNELAFSGCSGLLSVIGAMDIFLSKDCNHLSFTHLQHPCLSLGLIAIRQSPYFGSFALSSGEALSDALKSKTPLPRHDLTLVKNSYQHAEPVSWPARVGIDDTAYELLKTFAYKTYVPSSETSRVAGAGAGLTDND